MSLLLVFMEFVVVVVRAMVARHISVPPVVVDGDMGVMGVMGVVGVVVLAQVADVVMVGGQALMEVVVYVVLVVVGIHQVMLRQELVVVHQM
jgi:hypothetical protein